MTRKKATVKPRKKKQVRKKKTAPKRPRAVENSSSSKRQENLRRILLDKRKEVLRDMEEHLGKHLQGVLPARENEVFDSGDQATQDVSEELDLSFQERRNQSLKLIDEAIQRLEDETYGICEECGIHIPEPRLNAMPFAKFCVSCQETQETFDKIEREEDRFK